MSSAFKVLAASNAVAVEQNPDPFSFNNLTNVGLSSTATSNQITITGLTANAPVTVSVNTGQVDAGTTALSGVWASSKEVTVSGSGTIVVRPRRTASSSYYTTTSQTVTVGSGNTTWTNRTVDISLSPSGFVAVTNSNATPSATYTFSTGSFTGLTSGQSYYLRSYSTGGTSVDFAVDIDGSNFSPTNPSSTTFVFSGTENWTVRMDAAYYWSYYDAYFYIQSPYSGSNTSTIRYRVDTPTAGGIVGSNSASVPADTTHVFTFTISSLPVGDGSYAGVNVGWRGDVWSGTYIGELSWDGTNWVTATFTDDALSMSDPGAPSLGATSVTFYFRMRAEPTAGNVASQSIYYGPIGRTYKDISTSCTVTAT